MEWVKRSAKLGKRRKAKAEVAVELQGEGNKTDLEDIQKPKKKM